VSRRIILPVYLQGDQGYVHPDLGQRLPPGYLEIEKHIEN